MVFLLTFALRVKITLELGAVISTWHFHRKDETAPEILVQCSND